MPFVPKIKVNTDRTVYTDDELTSKYTYENSIVQVDPVDQSYKVETVQTDLTFKLDLKVPKVGILLVGLGGNNGTTFTAASIANKNNITFQTRDGPLKANYFGSVTQSSTIKLGINEKGDDVYVPFDSLVPMVNPNDFVISGWDINEMDLYDGMNRAKVLEYDLRQQLKPYMEKIKPMPSIYYPDFIALNQDSRANNCFNRVGKDGKIDTTNKWDHVEKIRSDIRNFKESNKLDKVLVLWTANTERYSELIEGVNDTKENLMKSIKEGHAEVSPSTVFAVASILEGSPYINGSPQNTFVPGLMEFALEQDVFIGGDDFKSGQTKFKSVMAQYLVDAGIKIRSIASYNHLGNNDGFNLSSPKQFRSKEISKASVVDDVIESNPILYDQTKKEGIDHCIVIKYLPAVGDSKVAMDEYYSELMLGGHNRISIHNICEDSLLATPLIIDLLVMTEFMTRVKCLKAGSDKYEKMYTVLTLLSYWLKAPLTRPSYKPVNALNRQRMAVDNFLRILIGLKPLDELRFEERLN